MIENLKILLQSNKDKLTGEWIRANSSYDGYICRILNMKEAAERYWDAVWEGNYIEFKKGNSIWLDLVRYSEVLLKTNGDAAKDTLTLFFIPDSSKSSIEKIICVKTYNIIKTINLTEDIAKQLIALNNIVPRSLNAQASLTKNDVKRISEFVI